MYLSDLLQSYDINFENERKRIEFLFARTPVMLQWMSLRMLLPNTR